MASPRFVVKRIGNDYKILPADAQGVAMSALPLAGGGLLALKGLFRGGVFGQLMLLTGGGLIYYGMTGKNPLDEIRGAIEKYQSGGSILPTQDRGPSHQHDDKTTTDQLPEDDVDEAAMESFPASDPPAHPRSPTTASVPRGARRDHTPGRASITTDSRNSTGSTP